MNGAREHGEVARRHLRGQGTALQALGEGLAVEEGHREVGPPVGQEPGLEEGDEARRVEALHALGLGEEPPPLALRGRELRAEHLERQGDRPVGQRIARRSDLDLVDDPASAFPEHPQRLEALGAKDVVRERRQHARPPNSIATGLGIQHRILVHHRGSQTRSAGEAVHQSDVKAGSKVLGGTQRGDGLGSFATHVRRHTT